MNCKKKIAKKKKRPGVGVKKERKKIKWKCWKKKKKKKKSAHDKTFVLEIMKQQQATYSKVEFYLMKKTKISISASPFQY